MLALVASEPTTKNVTCTLANTEYSYTLPAGTIHFDMQARGNTLLRFAFAPGVVATPTGDYATLKPGFTWETPSPLWGQQTLTIYLASPSAGAVAEIISWR